MTNRLPTNSPLKGVFQLAYVTRDFERAVKMFADDYGMTEFGRLSNLEMTVPSGEKMKIEVGLAWIDDIQIEIIEPRGGHDGLYRDALDGRDSVVVPHHLGMLLDTREAIDEERARAARAGQQVVLDGEIAGMSAFMYVDARPLLGQYLEYLYFSPERLAFHRSMPRF